MTTLGTKAYAKINLALSIRGRRPDGFHELESLVVGLDWWDRLTATSHDGVAFSCDVPELAGPDNLAWRAALMLQSRHRPSAGVRMHLKKRISVGAGLGGGSSDAAAALILCNTLWKLGLSREALAAVGADLGSDVPLFFHLPHVWMAGRGEQVRPVRLAWRGWVVLIRTGLFVPTSAAYGHWRPADACIDAGERFELIRRTADAGSLERLTFNDLEAAVFRAVPDVQHARRRLREAGIERPLRITGAGSVMYLLEDDESAARRMAARVLETGVVSDVAVVRVLDSETLEVTEE